MFHCGQCSYKSKRKYDVGRHEKAMHGDFKKNYMVNHGNDGGNNYGQSHKHVYNELKNFDIRLKENFKLFVSGPSRCGKTAFVSKLIENIKSFAKQPPGSIIYVYKIWQNKYEEMESFGVNFMEDNEKAVEI